MKPLIFNDVLAAVSYAATVSPRDRVAQVEALLAEAEMAHFYRRAYHSAHPVFGDGSLMTAALRHNCHGETAFATREGRAAWICVLLALQRHYA